MAFDIRNPAAPSQIVACYQETAIESLDALVDKSRAAQKKWKTVPQPQRGAILTDFVDALEKRSEDIAVSITKEMGKTLNEARGEVAKAISEARSTIARASAPIGEVFPSHTPGTVAYTTRRPRGLVFGINPWNFPFSTPMRKAIPALLYGNAIILKPASLAPGAIAIMAEVAGDVFLEAGILVSVIGGGALGQALCEHTGVDAVCFTGSVNVGKQVARAAAGHLAEVSLELGGKNAAIVNDASDLNRVIDQVIASAFAISGQRCTAVSRVLVHRDLEADVLAALSAGAEALHPVDGHSENAEFGPLASAKQLHVMQSYITRALSDGASVVAGGHAPSSETGGYFFAPTILSGITRDMAIAKEEVFGPILSVLTYETIDEALAVTNDVAFGLSSCLFSERSDVIERFLAESESGMLHVNSGSFPESHLPFVGVKDSALGVGGSNGPSTIQFYTTEHTVYRRAKV